MKPNFDAFTDSRAAMESIRPQLTLTKLLMNVLAIAFIVGAYLWMAASDEAEQERAEQRKQQIIAEAKLDFARQQHAASVAGLQDDANHMMWPCCQAHDKP